MKKRSFCALALFLAAALLLTGCMPCISFSTRRAERVKKPETPAGYLEYKNVIKNFAISYPSHWEIDRNSTGDVISFYNWDWDWEEGYALSDWVTVIREDLEDYGSLRDYVYAIDRHYSLSSPDYKRISYTETRLNGLTAIEVVCQTSFGEGEEEINQIVQTFLRYRGSIFHINAGAPVANFRSTEGTLRTVTGTFYPLED